MAIPNADWCANKVQPGFLLSERTSGASPVIFLLLDQLLDQLVIQGLFHFYIILSPHIVQLDPFRLPWFFVIKSCQFICKLWKFQLWVLLAKHFRQQPGEWYANTIGIIRVCSWSQSWSEWIGLDFPCCAVWYQWQEVSGVSGKGA